MPASTASKYLDLKALAALARLRFTTRNRIEGGYSGRHASRQKGGSGEFVDFREYTPGEDLRRLDWKVYARTGKSYLRQYQDETNLLCTLAIDASSSMMFGGNDSGGETGSKLEYAKYLATGFSHVISLGQDQVGLAVLGDSLQEFLPCAGAATHMMHVQSKIENIRTRESLRLAPRLKELFTRTTSRGVIILISDFLNDDLDELFAAVRMFRHRQFEVIMLHIVHPDEEKLPDGKSFRFEGLEGEGRIDCSPEQIRDEYERQFAQHLKAIRTSALANGCHYRLVSTAQPYLSVISNFLVERTG